MLKRDCIFAKQGWYPADETALRETIENYPKSSEKKKALGVLSPHAGYYFSGRCANMVYSSVEIPSRVLVLSVSHSEHFDYLPLYPAGSWITPLGEIEIDEEMNAELLKLDFVRENAQAHSYEHSGELQLPFLKYYGADLKLSIINVGLAPLYLPGETPFETIENFGQGLGNALQKFSEEVLIVASSDMSHETPDARTRKQDKYVREIIEDYEPRELYDVLLKHRITMCGGIPALLMFEATRVLGGKKAEIVEYYTSSDITGEQFGRSVGYLGLRVVK